MDNAFSTKWSIFLPSHSQPKAHSPSKQHPQIPSSSRPFPLSPTPSHRVPLHSTPLRAATPLPANDPPILIPVIMDTTIMAIIIVCCLITPIVAYGFYFAYQLPNSSITRAVHGMPPIERD